MQPSVASRVNHDQENLEQPREWTAHYGWIFALILVSATVMAYRPAWNGKPIWDDDAHLTRPDLRSLHGLVSIWSQPGVVRQYYPLTHTIFWVEGKLSGRTWFLYHLVNIGLHASSALLLWRILLRLKIPGAWFAAGVFALHPIQVESVAWISELKNTLSGFLFFLSAWFYLRFDDDRRREFYWLAFGLFVLGLLSKSVIAVLPAALLIVFWWKRGTIVWKRDVQPLIPFFVIGAGSGLFTAWVERNFIGAQGEVFELSIMARVLIAGRAFWFYLFKLFWPVKLTFIYPRWEVDPSVWWQYLFPIGAFLLVLVTWIARHRTRAPLAALMFFMIMLFPVLGFLNVYPFRFSFVANHFQYLANIGCIAVIASTFARWSENGRANLRSRAFLTIPIFVLAVLTWRAAAAYSDPVVLYRSTLRDNPSCWMAENNLGIELLQQEKVSDSIEHFQKSLELWPQNAEAHTNLGNAFSMQRRFEEAIVEYAKAVVLLPEAIAPSNNLAWLLATCPDQSLRDGPKAIDLAEGLVQTSAGKDPVIFRTLAAAYAEENEFDEAVRAAERGLELARAEGDSSRSRTFERELGSYRNHRRPGD